jgi:hypothetical protein
VERRKINKEVWVEEEEVKNKNQIHRKVGSGADKYLARPGRKQATATKLGIYSTYSPRSSIYFLALRCYSKVGVSSRHAQSEVRNRLQNMGMDVSIILKLILKK